MVPMSLECAEGQAIGGWISPDGDFFQARYEQHDEVAKQIVQRYL